MKKTFAQKFVATILVGELIVFTALMPQQTQAFGVGSIVSSVGSALGVPSPTGALNDIFTDLGIEQEDVVEGLNTGSINKFLPPTVTVRFDPPNPKDGDLVTAHAQPKDFASQTQDMYYTWMLKRGGEGSVEDAKIAAARIVAQGRSPAQLDFGSAPNTPDGDTDAFDAIIGGEGNKGRNNYCYIHDFEKGEDYELAEGGNSETGVTCPGGTYPVCARQFVSECPIEIPPVEGAITITNDGMGNTSGGGAIGQGLPTPRRIGINRCAIVNESPNCSTTDTGIGASRDGDNPFSVGAGTPFCTLGEVFCASATLPGGLCPEPAALYTEYTTTGTVAGSSCDDLVLAGTLERGAACELSTQEDIDNLCTSIEQEGDDSIHLFPHAPGFVTGDGEFGEEEEAFWGTFSTNPNTAGTNFNNYGDEANVAGLGVTSFTWRFQTGDEINLVVEGFTGTTEHTSDSSRKVMWAFLNNTCDAHDFIDDGEADVLEYVNDDNNKIDVIELSRDDLNECIDEGFIEPGFGGQPGRLELRLDYDPKTPMVGSTDAALRGQFGSWITATAGAQNATKNAAQIFYRWCAEPAESIGESTIVAETGQNLLDENRSCTEPGAPYPQLFGPSPDSPIEVSSRVPFDPATGFPAGLGLTQLTFRINDIAAIDGAPWLRLRVEAAENYTLADEEGGGQTADGGTVVYIPMRSSGFIEAYNTPASGELVLGTPICDSGEGTAINALACRVATNEIIGLSVEGAPEISNFHWTIIGDARTCQNNCPPPQGRDHFIAINDVRQSNRLVVSARGTNINTGQEVALSRSFVITEPFIVIDPGAGVERTQLGAHIGDDGAQYLEQSKKTFRAGPGTVSLSARVRPSFAQSNANILWNVLGEEFQGPSVSLEMTESPVTVNARGPYALPVGVVNTLRESFRMRVNAGGEYRPAQVTILPDSTSLSQGVPQQFFAAIATNTPGYFLFLLRIVLTIGLVLFLSALVMSVNPQSVRVRRD